MGPSSFWERWLALGHETVVELEGGKGVDGGVLAVAVPGKRGLRWALEGAYRGGIGGLANVLEGAVAEGQVVAFVCEEDAGRGIEGDHGAVLCEVFLELAMLEAHDMA